jgi:DNA-nicking Smr family endonuclease
MSRKPPMSNKTKARGNPFEVLRPLRDEFLKQESASSTIQIRPGATPKRRAETDEPGNDATLLHRVFAGVTPIDRSRGRIPKHPIERSLAVERIASRGREEVRAEADAVHEHLRILVDGRVRFEVSDDGQRVEGRRLDVPIDAVRKLRRGLVPIDARLDLHGMVTEQARAQVQIFLRTMRARAERCVLVIHGKGDHSPSGAGVLRGEIAAWLSQGSSSEYVAAFATAQGGDGGEGAVYVLLRR